MALRQLVIAGFNLSFIGMRLNNINLFPPLNEEHPTKMTPSKKPADKYFLFHREVLALNFLPGRLRAICRRG
jgi:hypothetical protein